MHWATHKVHVCVLVQLLPFLLPASVGTSEGFRGHCHTRPKPISISSTPAVPDLPQATQTAGGQALRPQRGHKWLTCFLGQQLQGQASLGARKAHTELEWPSLG